MVIWDLAVTKKFLPIIRYKILDSSVRKFIMSEEEERETISRETWWYRSTAGMSSVGDFDYDGASIRESIFSDHQDEEEEVDLKNPELKISTDEYDYEDDITVQFDEHHHYHPSETRTLQYRTHRLMPKWPTAVFVAANAFWFYTIISVAKVNVHHEKLGWGNLPIGSTILVLHACFGLCSIAGGWIGDRVYTQRIKAIQMGLCICLLSVICSRIDIVFSCLLALIAMSIVLPNSFQWGLECFKAREHTSLETQQRELVATLILALVSGMIIAQVPVIETEWIRLAFAGAVWFFTSIWFMFYTLKDSVVQDQVTSRASVARRVSRVLWATLKSTISCQFIFIGLMMLIGGTLLLFGLLCLNLADTESLHFGRAATTKLVLVAVTSLGCFILHIASMRGLDPTSPAVKEQDCLRNELDSRQASNVIRLLPIGCTMIFAGFVKGQLYNTYFLQTCQMDRRIGTYLFNPDDLSLVANVIALVTIPILSKTLDLLTNLKEKKDINVEGNKNLKCLCAGVLLSLVALFLSVVIELHRRGHGLLALTSATASCHQPVSRFSVVWAVPQIFLVGVSTVLIQISSRHIFFKLSEPSFGGLIQGLGFALEAVGMILSLTVTDLLSHWYEYNTTSTDLVMILLLFTTFGCATYSAIMTFTAKFPTEL